ncbi:LysR family transcriptional regulator [Actinomadura rupiterrae]|uniref:LysR family transcriptional regulator n=1 Tax=Actinomadura rupiterrae TaxID=559627 RepID=UPI0020A4758D|nr:LysR family transcriptional regulator [Actinomadura rupiterrae]MCP2343067.1 DNA-binding transcriptional LysR family regulator [Actinomadura rupiterrae]
MPLADHAELETFLVLARELHFGRTAQCRQVSRQRVSQLVASLERRVGGALFERTSRRVALTDLGRQLLDELEPPYRGVQDALANAAATARGVKGTLRVGAFDILWTRLFVEAAEVLRARRPDVRVAISEISAGDAFRPLELGDVDVMNASLPVLAPDLSVGPVLLAEPRVLALPARHPLARKPDVALEDLAEIPILTAPYMPDSWNDDRAPRETPGGRPIARGPHIHSVAEALAYIGSGKGAFPFGAHMTHYHPYPGVAYLPIRDAPPIEWALVWATGRRTRLLQDFAQIVRAELRRARPT